MKFEKSLGLVWTDNEDVPRDLREGFLSLDRFQGYSGFKLVVISFSFFHVWSHFLL